MKKTDGEKGASTVKQKKNGWITPVTVLVILLLVVGAFYGLRQKKIQEGPLAVSADGYQQIMELDGTLYLVDRSSNIYTLGWNTGEKTHVLWAPQDVAWVSDPKMERIFYIRDEILFSTEVLTGQERELGPIPGWIQTETVTENYVVYWKNDSQWSTSQIWCFDINTGETRALTQAAENVGVESIVLGEQEDQLYVTCYRNVQEDGTTDGAKIEAWDLSTGEIRVITETRIITWLWEGGNTYGDYLYFGQDSALYRVLITGGEMEYVQGRGPHCIYRGITETGKLLCENFSDNTFFLIDLETGTEETVYVLTQNGVINGVYSNGERYAILCESGTAELVFGDMPK